MIFDVFQSYDQLLNRQKTSNGFRLETNNRKKMYQNLKITLLNPQQWLQSAAGFELKSNKTFNRRVCEWIGEELEKRVVEEREKKRRRDKMGVLLTLLSS